MDTHVELKRDVRDLELENEVLKKEKLEAEKETLASHQIITDLRETLILNEETNTTNQARAEKEILELKEKVKVLLAENETLLGKVQSTEHDLATNKLWNKSSQALDWLNTHYSRKKKGLGISLNRPFTQSIESM